MPRALQRWADKGGTGVTDRGGPEDGRSSGDAPEPLDPALEEDPAGFEVEEVESDDAAEPSAVFSNAREIVEQ